MKLLLTILTVILLSLSAQAAPVTWVMKTHDYALRAGDHVMADAADGGFSLHLPHATGSGHEVDVCDADGSWYHHPVQVTGLVGGESDGLLLSTAGAYYVFIDLGGAVGWGFFNIAIAPDEVQRFQLILLGRLLPAR